MTEKREIKFRAWDKKGKFMFFPDKVGLNDDNAMRDIGRPASDFEMMQFTGLKDKNGKEIYEGDIVKTKKSVLGEIHWSEVRAGFFIRFKNIYNNKRNQYWRKSMEWATTRNQCEVIGNIYEEKT